MTKDLQDKLYEKYPKIFGQKDLSMYETAMCWGIDVSDGWYNILDVLCHNIQSHIDRNNLPQVQATQIKEKYGGLRFYTNFSDEYIDGLIDMAANMSYRTCEYCGNPGKSNDEGWIVTLCDPCRKQYNERLGIKE